MKDNILIYITRPSDDWLIGIEYIPSVMLPTIDNNNVSIFSIGLFIFRIDFLINNNEE